MAETIVIHPNMQGYKDMTAKVGLILEQGKKATVEITEGEKKKRSLSANALQAVWIKEIANHEGQTEKYVRDYIKREIGLPILRGENNKTAEALNWTLHKINYDLMTPAQKAKVLDLYAVTSIMTTQQHKRFRNQVQRHYRDEADLELEVR